MEASKEAEMEVSRAFVAARKTPETMLISNGWMDGWMDGLMEEQAEVQLSPPVSYRTSSPLGPLTKKLRKSL